MFFKIEISILRKCKTLGVVIAAFLALAIGCTHSKGSFCYWETIDGSTEDGFAPWWDTDARMSDADCLSPNSCGGCSVLAQEPGVACGRCGGQYVCTGPDSVVCDDPCAEFVGCSDGEREGFLDPYEFPNIAACAGGWSRPGILDAVPECNHMSGKNTLNPAGLGCSAADLCAEGWHVCNSLEEIAAASHVGCNYAWEPGTFWVAAISGNGGRECGPDGTDDLFGCGSVGLSAGDSCAPLTRSSGDKCENIPDEWDCPGGLFGSNTEAIDVKKHGVEGGGVLCCRDEPVDSLSPDAGVPDGGN